MSKVGEKIRHLIKTKGAMPLDQYMEMALSDSEAGYYMTRDPLGRQGDFITAPEISQVFGELIGLWAVDVWQRSGASESVHLVELGPGRGTLMQDALRAAKTVPAFCQAAKIHFVETSPILRHQQAATHENITWHKNITWHEDIHSLPEAPCLIIANEFFDALPIKQFIKTAEGWQERMVDMENNRFVYSAKNCNASDIANMPNLAPYGDLQAGDIIEHSPMGQAIMAQLARHICAYGGALLVIDYGYGTPSAGDSLQALKQHKPVSPLADPGTADLTAHVNFAALRAIAETFGANVYGPIAQGNFLQQLGAETRFAALKTAQQVVGNMDCVEALTAAQTRLTAPEQMGSLFKALAVTARTDIIPAGFAED